MSCPAGVIKISGTARIVEVARQGPPGPSGDDSLLRQAATALGGHRIVVANANGTISYADHANLAHAEIVLGITVAAVAAGEFATVRTQGRLQESSWSWTPGEYLWLGATGVLTQVLPLTGFRQLVARALTATEIFISIEESMRL